VSPPTQVIGKTLKAIGKITEIRSRRQERHYEARMQRAKQLEKKAEKVQLEKEIHLIRAPASLISKEKDKLRVKTGNAKAKATEAMEE
jgi:large subunit ribosomal protein L24e